MSFEEKRDIQRVLWEEMRKLTLPKCMGCKGIKNKYRCCDRTFCDKVRAMLELWQIKGYTYREDQEVPYMGKHGCTIPAHHRPICASYVCPENFEEDPAFKEKYVELAKLCFESETPPIPRKV